MRVEWVGLWNCGIVGIASCHYSLARHCWGKRRLANVASVEMLPVWKCCQWGNVANTNVANSQSKVATERDPPVSRDGARPPALLVEAASRRFRRETTNP